MENSLVPFGTGEIFLNKTPMACALRSRIDTWEIMILKSFCEAKDIVNRTNWQLIDWGKIFTILISDRGLIFKIYKEFKNLIPPKKPNNPIKKNGV